MKINGNYVLQEIGNDFVLIPTGNNPDNYQGMCTFNETGAFIWHQIERNKGVEDMLDAVVKVYDVDRDGARKDVNLFLDRLENINIITRADG